MKASKIIGFFLAATALAILLAVITVAHAQSNFKYYVDIAIANTSGTAYTTRIAVPVSASTLINNLYIKADATDTELYSGGAITQLMSTNIASNAANWFTGIISVPANSNSAFRLYMGDPTYTRNQKLTSLTTDTASIAHNANLNITSNLTIEASGTYLYSAPTATQYFIRKPNQYELQVTTTSYRFVITPASSQTVEGISPTASSTTNLSVTGAASNWQAVVSNDATTSYVLTTSDSYVTDYYVMSNTAYPPGVVVSVGASATWKGTSDVWSVSVLPVLRLGSNDVFGTVISKTDTAWSTESWTNLSRPGGGSWTMADINDLLAGVALSGRNASGTESWVSYFAINVEYTTASAVSSAITLNNNKTVKGTYDGSNLVMYVDGASVASTAFASTIATSTATLTWQFNGLMDRISIGDSSVASPTWRLYYDFSPNQVTANTISDLSAGNNPASITWASNPASVTATLGSLTPTGAAAASISATPSVPDIVATITQPAMFTETAATDENTGLPFYDIVALMSEWTGFPILSWYITLFAILAVCLGAGVYGLFHSLTFSAFASGIPIFAASYLNVWGWAFFIIYALLALGLVILDNRTTL